jgi:dTDP-4-dehydrorhamnose 3,5-epimerase
VKLTPTTLPDVVLIEPRVFSDERGAFFEMWREERYSSLAGAPFRQDNVSVSRRGVVRGLHFQHPRDQGKLVSVLAGAAFDVVVDVRRGSPSFGKWVAEELSAANRRQLWIPPGFAHGFQALEDDTVFLYKVTELYAPDCERTIRPDDPALAIAWPLPPALLAPRDAAAPLLAAIPPGHLPPL